MVQLLQLSLQLSIRLGHGGVLDGEMQRLSGANVRRDDAKHVKLRMRGA